MRRQTIITGIVFLGMLAAPIIAGEKASEKCLPPALKHSDAFNRMAALAGKWEGTCPSKEEKGKMDPVSVEYSLTSGGSVVVEKLFPGTPHEMTSMYCDEKGKLSMTHYCMLGNQPHLALKGSDEKSLSFDFKNAADINPKKDMHMHALKISFSDPDHIVQDWTSFEKGKESDHVVITLERKK